MVEQERTVEDIHTILPHNIFNNVFFLSFFCSPIGFFSLSITNNSKKLLYFPVIFMLNRPGEAGLLSYYTYVLDFRLNGTLCAGITRPECRRFKCMELTHLSRQQSEGLM